MIRRASTLFAAAILLLLPAASHATLAPYVQSFEGLNISDPAALSADGWVVYGNVFTANHATYLYGYGPYPAPNPGGGFSAIATGQGGVDQGLQQLSVYNDYNNTDHAKGYQIESNVYREQTIGGAEGRSTWTFQFDAKMGNLVSPSTALAFIKTINPSAGYATTNFISADMTSIPGVWNTYTLSITLDPSLAGQLLQIGFATTASNYLGSGVMYDNVVFSKTNNVGVDPARANVFDLRPASPNPFPGSTRIDFSLPLAGSADLTVYDVTGRRVATLFHGEAAAGPHSATWNGHVADGRPAPAGVYRAVLQTAAGRMTRSLVLAH